MWFLLVLGVSRTFAHGKSGMGDDMFSTGNGKRIVASELQDVSTVYDPRDKNSNTRIRKEM